ncbi:hypothetical protein GCK72_014402 [Caenorhabditis remanei]|uniref:ETS domain-containing protein n=1 Tax=Caenorhabditis remanei TaxID=31234 RepID=A0A6A5GTD9_CAERE|nr:hypothetical protein GCK72_014402 [Caenorhabditis remanei]KAF1757944.1 hypothetical protein GCK72_014402 [Caenorhabditis remanei]
MDRLLILYSQQCIHPTTAEMCRNFLLDILKSGKEDVVRWRNPELLEFEITNETYLRKRFYENTGKNLNRVMVDGIKFIRKVPGHENVYRFYFVPKHLLPQLPRKTFAQIVRFSTETAV